MATDAEEIRTQTSPCPIPDNSFSTLSIKITRKNQDRHWKLRFIYLQCCEYRHTSRRLEPNTGTGHTSPALLIYLFVELLQKCQVVQLESLKTGVAECIVMDQVGVENPVPTEDEDEDDESENAEENADTGLLHSDAVTLYNQAESLQPNLHLLGHLFLSRPMSHAFNCILLFQFVSIGISYVLAGSEAYAALLNVRHIYVIPAFTWILTLGILVAHTIIQPITSLLTLLKGILLIVTTEKKRDSQRPQICVPCMQLKFDLLFCFYVTRRDCKRDASALLTDFTQQNTDPVVSESSARRTDNLPGAQHPLVLGSAENCPPDVVTREADGS
ncbi:hypothetical protein E3U43_006439 [Larimichthys crocea]|uniref:Uncharacterized protein n=1 Tax=Larimichthys crocea TaxID=215358 RepID=A0ACD3RKA2_LARCR|nr:hypothetical protein E3U43_006439 [Larimichthys crocea]